MKSLILIKNRGEQTFVRSTPDYIDNYILTSGVPQAAPVPSSGSFVIFGATNNFFAAPNYPINLPNINTINGTGCEINPSSWSCEGLTGIGLVSNTSAIVSLSYYKA